MSWEYFFLIRLTLNGAVRKDALVLKHFSLESVEEPYSLSFVDAPSSAL